MARVKTSSIDTQVLQKSMTHRRKKLLLYGVGGVLALFAILSPTLFYQLPTTILNISGRTLTLDIVSTALEQQRGLSGRASLASQRGMVFIFTQPYSACHSVRQARFSVDMVWLNSAKQVTEVRQYVTPAQQSKGACTAVPEKYLIEMNTGEVQKLHIHSGQSLKFS